MTLSTLRRLIDPAFVMIVCLGATSGTIVQGGPTPIEECTSLLALMIPEAPARSSIRAPLVRFLRGTGTYEDFEALLTDRLHRREIEAIVSRLNELDSGKFVTLMESKLGKSQRDQDVPLELLRSLTQDLQSPLRGRAIGAFLRAAARDPSQDLIRVLTDVPLDNLSASRRKEIQDALARFTKK